MLNYYCKTSDSMYPNMYPNSIYPRSLRSLGASRSEVAIA